MRQTSVCAAAIFAAVAVLYVSQFLTAPTKAAEAINLQASVLEEGAQQAMHERKFAKADRLLAALYQTYTAGDYRPGVLARVCRLRAQANQLVGNDALASQFTQQAAEFQKSALPLRRQLKS